MHEHLGWRKGAALGVAVALPLCLVGVTILSWPGDDGPVVEQEWGQRGERPGSFLYIESLVLDTADNLYVVDRNTARITVLGPAGQVLRTFGGRPQLESPVGVAVDAAGNVLVGDFALHMLCKFAPDGQLLWSTRGDPSHPLRNVELIAVDLEGNVYVADSGNNRIQVFDPGGGLVRRFGEFGQQPGQFRNPEGVWADSRTGSLYVTDYGNGRVQKFDLQGQFVAEWSGPYGLDRPIGVTVHPLTGLVYVVESGRGQVQVFEPDGTFVEVFGRPGSGPGQFDNPHGIAIDRSGRILVGDTGNHRVQVLREGGSVPASRAERS